MKIVKEIIFLQANLNSYAKHIFLKDQNTILCGLNFKNIRIIDLNDLSDYNLNFSKDLGIYLIYINSENTLYLANQNCEIECYLRVDTNELKNTLKGHTGTIFEMDSIKESNLISSSTNEIIIWNMINGEKLNIL